MFLTGGEVLVMNVAVLLDRYRPGCGDWDWATEFETLTVSAEHAELTAALRRRVEVDGVVQPVLLGDDGRVWDGHHHLCVLNDLGWEWVPVTFEWGDDRT